MAWGPTSLKVLPAAIVVARILGLHAWAMATEHRDRPARQPETPTIEVAPTPTFLAGLVAEPTVG
jgi:hypothetical protein